MRVYEVRYRFGRPGEKVESATMNVQAVNAEEAFRATRKFSEAQFPIFDPVAAELLADDVYIPPPPSVWEQT